MFKFLKGLLKKEIVIERKNFQSWFSEKAKEIISEEKEREKKCNEDISQARIDLKEALQELNERELHNPNVSVRELQFMLGNRKAYIQRTEHFLEEFENILE